MRLLSRTVIHGLVIAAGAAVASAQGPGTPKAGEAVPAYRSRILGVFDSQSGEPVEGAEVIDALTKTFALTTKTGTVSLVFLPEGGTLVRIRKLGYAPTTLMVAISPADTIPITVLLGTAVQTLPTVVTKDSARKYLSPSLREFDERSNSPAIIGQFVKEAELRKNEGSTVTNLVRRFHGMRIDCKGSSCVANTSRTMSASGRPCAVTVYINGMMQPGVVNLETLLVVDYAGIEFYPSAATTPTQYNKNGSCGVMLLWTRER